MKYKNSPDLLGADLYFLHCKLAAQSSESFVNKHIQYVLYYTCTFASTQKKEEEKVKKTPAVWESRWRTYRVVMTSLEHYTGTPTLHNGSFLASSYFSCISLLRESLLNPSPPATAREKKEEEKTKNTHGVAPVVVRARTHRKRNRPINYDEKLLGCVPLLTGLHVKPQPGPKLEMNVTFSW